MSRLFRKIVVIAALVLVTSGFLVGCASFMKQEVVKERTCVHAERVKYVKERSWLIWKEPDLIEYLVVKEGDKVQEIELKGYRPSSWLTAGRGGKYCKNRLVVVTN